MSENQNYRDERREYQGGPLHKAHLDSNPTTQFNNWLQTALQQDIPDATACSLATVDATGQPAVRIVLLKHANAEGFSWYTSYGSSKGAQISGNNKAAMLFYWSSLHRQVRVEGLVSKLNEMQAKEYFQSRPRESQVSAAASSQSASIKSRNALEEAAKRIRETYTNTDIPKPNDWGGYCLKPTRFEFWQGRENRLHDRFEYIPGHGDWAITRLQP